MAEEDDTSPCAPKEEIAALIKHKIQGLSDRDTILRDKILALPLPARYQFKAIAQEYQARIARSCGQIIDSVLALHDKEPVSEMFIHLYSAISQKRDNDVAEKQKLGEQVESVLRENNVHLTQDLRDRVIEIIGESSWFTVSTSIFMQRLKAMENPPGDVFASLTQARTTPDQLNDLLKLPEVRAGKQ